MRRLLLLGIALFLLAGCTVQEARIVYRPEETSDPTAVPTDTPAPERLEVPAVTGEPFVTDANGVPIQEPLTHYLDYYVTFKDIRIYEYREGTFLDGILINSFPEPLIGGIRLTFADANDVVYGYGDLYTADGKLKLLPGENRVMADILTEVDVQMMDFTITVIDSFTP